MELSYTWVKQVTHRERAWWRGAKRGVTCQGVERRPLAGMLLHIDGSRHQWFQDERWYDLDRDLTMPRARFTTHNWWRRNRRRR